MKYFFSALRIPESLVRILLDVLEGINPIKICTGYTMDGKSIDTWLIQSEEIERCEPEYIEVPGWDPRSSEEWSAIAAKGYEALSEEIKKYISKLEDLLGN